MSDKNKAPATPENNGSDCGPCLQPSGSHLSWHMLCSIRSQERLEEVMAAACDDGIGIIARWMRREDDGWDVDVMDTEADHGMLRIVTFGEEEPVPPSPPESLLTANSLAQPTPDGVGEPSIQPRKDRA